jgi:hypothetical protein
MKNKVLMTMAMVVFIFKPADAAAAGVGVGNGGEGDKSQYIEKLKQELGVLDRPQSETLEISDFYEWCGKVTRMLRRELMRAERQIQFERLALAKQILKDALIVASESFRLDPQAASPITKKLVDRGVIYIDALDEIFWSHQQRDLLTSLLFLTNYVDFIIETEEGLDHPFYIPYICRHQTHPDSHFDFLRFTNRYLEYAKDQLSFLATHFTRIEKRDGEVWVTPVGNPKAFLKLIELGAFFVAQDIANTLEAWKHACLVMDLEVLSEVLRDFNLFNDRSIFPSIKTALYETRTELDRILSELSSFAERLAPDQFTSRELLNGRLILGQSQTQSLYLGGSRYVQKLVIEAQAQRTDPMFEVIVNGEVKGTIHLPPRDPQYVVTIADWADSIEFRHTEGGGIEMISVKVFEQEFHHSHSPWGRSCGHGR